MAPEHAPRSTSRRRIRPPARTVAALAVGLVVLAGCAEAVTGTGHGANPVVGTGSAGPSTPGATAFPSSPSVSAPSGSGGSSGGSSASAAPSDTAGPSTAIAGTSGPSASSATPSSATSGTPSGSASGSASGSRVGATCTSADYCDGFSDRTSGWDTTTDKDYSIGYSTRGGGSYLVQSRYDGVIYSTAPVDVTTFAPDYGVRIDADVAVTTPGAAPEVGLRCWGHDASNGGNAGFSGYLSRTTISITLRTEAGKIVPLANKTVTAGLPTDGRSVHIALACVQQKTSTGTVVADIAFAVNGKVQLEATYARSSTHYRWATGKDAGLLLGDLGARGYFDNVGITHIPG